MGFHIFPLIITGENESVGTTYEDVSGLGGSLSYLSSAASLEILSSSGDDAAAGT